LEVSVNRINHISQPSNYSILPLQQGEIATNEVPTQPSATHLAKLQGKRISSVACGGNGTICVSSMDVTQADIGLVLLRESELLSSINSYDIVDTIEVCIILYY